MDTKRRPISVSPFSILASARSMSSLDRVSDCECQSKIDRNPFFVLSRSQDCMFLQAKGILEPVPDSFREPLSSLGLPELLPSPGKPDAVRNTKPNQKFKT